VTGAGTTGADARILVVNAGSSSLKLRVLDASDSVVARADLPAPNGKAEVEASAAAIAGFGEIDAVGHRIVHGGTRYSGPVRLDAEVEADLRQLTDLAPLHQPKSLAALAAVNAALPDVPAVACFDTAFHAGMPAAATTYAIPHEWRKRWALRKYGFHGLSHAYASRRAAALVGRPVEALRIVTCHLGAGASLAAIDGGRSVDTTMGFTPLDGLVMATRSGSIDPGLVLWLEGHVGMPPEELASTLEHRSGLLGLAGTADMRAILAAESAGDAAAILALGVYLHRLRGSIGAMVAALGGLDVLVFTGGVGENSALVRRRVGEALGFLGVELDAEANAAAAPDAGYRAMLTHPMFVRSVPMGFFIYGGMIAMQALWAGPWLTRVARWSPGDAAAGLFTINVCMLVAFMAWGFVMPRLTARGIGAHGLMVRGLPLSLGLLAWIVLRPEPAGAWTWALWCVSCTFVSLSQPAIGQAFATHQAGRALSAYNLVIFAGVFCLQWGIGLAIDQGRAAGLSEPQAFRVAVGVFGLCSALAYFWYVRPARHWRLDK